MSETNIIREHERFAFLDEESHDQIANFLAENGEDLGQDDKTSHFFVLPDINVSVAQTSDRAVIKLKNGQIGRGIGFEEMPEVQLEDSSQADQAVALLRALTGLAPQVSEQFRHNYKLGDVELALKYTRTWGFHLELECTYNATTEQEQRVAAEAADTKINHVAGALGIELASDEELVVFNEEFKKTGKPRGEYTSEQIRTLYSSLFKLAATGRLPAQQTMDQPTVDWIAKNRPSELPDTMSPLQLSNQEHNILSNLALPPHWFVSEERLTTLHGQLHLARVAAFGSHLARESGKTDADARGIFIAGLLHDIRRSHDRDEPAHGANSAEWVKNNYSEIQDFFGDTAQDVDPELVYEVIRAHDGTANDTPEQYHWAVDCLKASDALDRYRQPKLKWWIRDEYLSLKPSQALKSTAFRTVVGTETMQQKSGDVTAATAVILQTGEA